MRVTAGCDAAQSTLAINVHHNDLKSFLHKSKNHVYTVTSWLSWRAGPKTTRWNGDEGENVSKL